MCSVNLCSFTIKKVLTKKDTSCFFLFLRTDYIILFRVSDFHPMILVFRRVEFGCAGANKPPII